MTEIDTTSLTINLEKYVLILQISHCHCSEYCVYSLLGGDSMQFCRYIPNHQMNLHVCLQGRRFFYLEDKAAGPLKHFSLYVSTWCNNPQDFNLLGVPIMKLLNMQSSPTHCLLHPVTVLIIIIWNTLSLQSSV